jgi:hypothetical protein
MSTEGVLLGVDDVLSSLLDEHAARLRSAAAARAAAAIRVRIGPGWRIGHRGVVVVTDL